MAFDALRAAQDAAYWAAVAATAAWLIGLATLALNAGGILVLLRQLDQNRKAIENATQATQIALSETRPWIEVTILDQPSLVVHRLGPDRTDAQLDVVVRLTNVGRTPAVNAWLNIYIADDPTSESVQRAVGNGMPFSCRKEGRFSPSAMQTRTGASALGRLIQQA